MKDGQSDSNLPPYPILRGWAAGGIGSQLVSWYFEPSQPQRITLGLKQTSIRLLFTLHTSHQTTNPLPPSKKKETKQKQTTTQTQS